MTCAHAIFSPRSCGRIIFNDARQLCLLLNALSQWKIDKSQVRCEGHVAACDINQTSNSDADRAWLVTFANGVNALHDCGDDRICVVSRRGNNDRVKNFTRFRHQSGNGLRSADIHTHYPGHG